MEHLMKTYEKDRIRSGLWKSDVFVKDKQNVNAALRILQEEVRICMKEWNDEKTICTRVYLKIGHFMLRAYTETNLSVEERANLAWAPVAFLRFWKAWVKISGLNVDTNFISLQTYEDFILSGHSLIPSMKLFVTYFPNHSFQPWTCVSNRCEELFSKLRGFCRGKSNLCMQDMLDLPGRIQKLEEMKADGRNFLNAASSQWPVNIDQEIRNGIENAEKEILKTVELLGMLSNLIKGKVLKVQNNDIVCINKPELNTFALLEQEEPD